MFLIGQNLLGLVDVDDDLRAQRNLDTERGDRLGLVQNGFQRISGLDPVVVAAIEEADVVDARVAKNQCRAAGRDLSRPATRPFLVGVAFGIAAIEDDGGVARDAERPQGDLELFRGAAVPIARILQLVGVEIKRPGNVVLFVLFPNAEVDVKEKESPGRGGLGASAAEQLAEPVGMDQLVVVRQTIDRQRRVRCPLPPAGLVCPHAGVP